MGLIRTVLVLSGLAFLGFGVAFLVNPDPLAQAMKIRLVDPRAYAELRAMYGGLEVGLGLFFIVSAGRTRWMRAALGAQVLTFLGLAGGRLVGILMMPRSDSLMLLFLGIELVAGLIGLITFLRVKTVLLHTVNHRLL